MKRIATYGLLCLSMMLFSCKKDNAEPEIKTKLDLITKKWVVESGPENEDYSSYSYEFKRNLTYEFQNPNLNTGSWEFNANETEILLDKANASLSQTIKILELTETKLSLQFVIPATDKRAEKVEVFNLK
jgi:hypothetical protein